SPRQAGRRFPVVRWFTRHGGGGTGRTSANLNPPDGRPEFRGVRKQWAVVNAVPVARYVLLNHVFLPLGPVDLPGGANRLRHIRQRGPRRVGQGGLDVLRGPAAVPRRVLLPDRPGPP